jgi:predicted RNA-binding protein Jag
MISELKNIVELIECDGQITLGHVAPVRNCVATATDEAQCLAMLVRREGETLDALLQRLDAAIADAYQNDRFADEINRFPQPSSAQPRKRRR